MFKDMLFRVFSSIFADKITLAHLDKLDEINRKKREERRISERFELDMYIGKPVICISNEWTNPVIGFAICVEEITMANNPVLIVHDVLTDEDIMVLGHTYHYTHQRFEALSRLDPFEACSLIYRNSNWDTEFTKVKSGTFDGYDVIRQKLEEKGFFRKVAEMKADRSV